MAQAGNSGSPPRPAHSHEKVIRLLCLAIACLAMGVAARALWNRLQQHLADSSRYRVTSDSITLTPQPESITIDVKSQVLRDANLAGHLSMLEDPRYVQRRLVDAFEAHPWVRQVARVELTSPNRASLQIDYRRPIAVVQLRADRQGDVLPVDAEGYRLPEHDVSDARKLYLPRIVDIERRPFVGEAWIGDRVLGAVAIVAHLESLWESARLLEIEPAKYPEVRRRQRFYKYTIRCSGGSNLLWGAAPEQEPAGEPPPAVKLANVKALVQKYGPLNSSRLPREIDLRLPLSGSQATDTPVAPRPVE